MEQQRSYLSPHGTSNDPPHTPKNRLDSLQSQTSNASTSHSKDDAVQDVDHLLARVEWPTLLFFAALFVLMESLDKLGLLEVLGDAVEEGILAVHPDYRLLAAMMMILWISALASAIIDNIPFATMMITILINIAENEELDLPLPPLVWALAFGACFGALHLLRRGVLFVGTMEQQRSYLSPHGTSNDPPHTPKNRLDSLQSQTSNASTSHSKDDAVQVRRMSRLNSILEVIEDEEKEKPLTGDTKPLTLWSTVKLVVLTAFCAMSVVLIALVEDEELHYYHLSVSPEDNTKLTDFGIFLDDLFIHALLDASYPVFFFSNASIPDPLARLVFDGPFLTEGGGHDGADHKRLSASVYRICEDVETLLVDSWDIPFNEEDDLILAENHVWHEDHEIDDLPSNCQEFLSLSTNLTHPISVGVAFSTFPGKITPSVVYAGLILVGMYVLITFEIIHRTLAALIASTVAVAVLSGLQGISKGDPWKVITYLSVFTAVISAFLDNVTTVLLLTPVTISRENRFTLHLRLNISRLCEVVQLDPVPVLIITVLFSNIGGAATPIGDPPNVLIVSNEGIIDRGINFGNFTLHMVPGVIFSGIVVYICIRWKFNDLKGIKVPTRPEIAALERGVNEVRRLSRRYSSISRHDQIKKTLADNLVHKLQNDVHELKQEPVPKNTGFEEQLADLKKKYGIRNRPLLIRSLVVLSIVIIMFFIHSVEVIHLSLGWIAILGAIAILILSDVDDIDHLLAQVEWPTLLFFAALFVLMESLDKLGLLEVLGDVVEDGIGAVDPDYRLLVATMLILWMSAIASAVIDNIPFATMMITIIINIGENEDLNLPFPPLVWALAFGACLGGNGTLIGASANVVCAGVAEQHGHTITFNRFTKFGFPVMLISVVVASIYLIICHVAFDWNSA
ncbi:unnamed protein product [Cyprideis torosa]|uniref:Citrate transporter-like domain-containing protein n=1 Tax=Cyprideis torosa TaxID=163714 RepID=A0A7R8ZMU5_9CRUS|nr:unnamed protein product [Cyprideis torosa]CAG0886395.1 unnamed protein product [Cyprideis torosa]